MRVSDNTNFNALNDSINRSRGRMQKFQLEGATQKKLNVPSDNPIGAAKILEVRTEKVVNEQLQTNGKLAEAFLNSTDHALAELVEIMVRAKEIALGQASGSNTNESSRMGVAEEIKQLYEQAVSLGNQRVGDRYLFSGYQTDKPAVSGTGEFQGDWGQMMVEIGRDVYIGTNLPGVEAFNTRPEVSGDGMRLMNQEEEGSVENTRQYTGPENVNAFGILRNLRTALLSGDIESIRNSLDGLDEMHSHLVANRAKVGSRIRGIQSSISTMERHDLTAAQLSTDIEDADMIEVMNNLSKEEIVFRNALQSSKRLVQPTLMDFLG